MMELNFLDKRRISVLAFLIILSFPISSIAQEANLSVRTQEAITKGLSAAKQKDWGSAIKYFKQAQEQAPFYPPLLFDLALAYDRAGGKELSSIAWYKAYLILYPEDTNAKQINQRITELGSMVKAETNRFISKAKESVSLLHKKDATPIYRNIIFAQAYLNDLSGAVATAHSVSGHVAYKEPVYSSVAEILSSKGQVEEAKRLAEEIKELGKQQDATDGLISPYWVKKEDEVLTQIFWGRVEAKDNKGAEDAINSIQDEQNRQASTLSFVNSLVLSGNVAAAKEIAGKINKKDYIRQAYADASIAEAQANADDFVEAKKSLELARKNITNIRKGEPALDDIYEHIAKTLATIGDFAGAEETIKLIQDDSKASKEDKFSGVGINFYRKDGIWTVRRPIKDSPAWRLGIKKGDRIVKINTEPTDGISIEDILKKLQGKPGTSVTITVLRGPQDETLVFNVVRSEIIETENTMVPRKKSVYYAILKKHLKNKDINAAKSVLSLMGDMPEAYMDIVEAQANAGDILGAKDTVEDIDDKRTRFLAQGLIAKAQGRLKEVEVIKIYALTAFSGFEFLENMPDSFQLVDMKDPFAAVSAIATAAQNMSFFLSELNKIETK